MRIWSPSTVSRVSANSGKPSAPPRTPSSISPSSPRRAKTIPVTSRKVAPANETVSTLTTSTVISFSSEPSPTGACEMTSTPSSRASAGVSRSGIDCPVSNPKEYGPCPLSSTWMLSRASSIGSAGSSVDSVPVAAQAATRMRGKVRRRCTAEACQGGRRPGYL